MFSSLTIPVVWEQFSSERSHGHPPGWVLQVVTGSVYCPVWGRPITFLWVGGGKGAFVKLCLPSPPVWLERFRGDIEVNGRQLPILYHLPNLFWCVVISGKQILDSRDIVNTRSQQTLLWLNFVSVYCVCLHVSMPWIYNSKDMFLGDAQSI